MKKSSIYWTFSLRGKWDTANALCIVFRTVRVSFKQILSPQKIFQKIEI